MKKNPIWHIFNSSIVSGPEKAVIPNLAALSNQCGHSIHVIFLREIRTKHSNDAIEYAKSFGLETTTIDVNQKLDLNAISHLRSLIKNINPALIHSHDVKAGIYTTMAGLFLGKQHYSTFHGFARVGFINKSYEILYFIFANIFSKLIVLNPFESNRVLKRMIKRSHIHLIPNGIQRETKEDASKKFNLDNEKTNIVSIGRLSPEKNHNIIIQSLLLLNKEELNSICFHLIGSGPLTETLKEQVKEYSLQNNIIFYGQLDNAQAYLELFDFFILPSLTEGIPICLLESLHAKSKLILSDIPAIRFVLPKDEMAFFFPPHSKSQLASIIKSILSGETKNFSLAHDVVKNRFNQDSWVNAHSLIYQEVLK